MTEENPTVSTLINKVHSWGYSKKPQLFILLLVFLIPQVAPLSGLRWLLHLLPLHLLSSLRSVEKQERYTSFLLKAWVGNCTIPLCSHFIGPNPVTGPLSPCLFNFYAEYIMRNAGLDEAQAWIKIARRSINNLRYADDTTLYGRKWRRTKEPLEKVKEESEKVGLKLNILKTKIMASGPITSWLIDGETVKTVTDFIFWGGEGLQNHCRW